MNGFTSAVVEGAAAPQIDVRTVMRGVWRRRNVVGLGLGAALAIGIGGGLAFGTRQYEAETVLLYRPRTSIAAGATSASYDSLSLGTQQSLVKIRSNLAETRQRLGVAATLEQLGAAVDVRLQKDTKLMTIGVRWDDPELAATIANVLRDVYLRSQARLRYREELAVVDQLYRTAVAEGEQLQVQSMNVDDIIEDLEATITLELSNHPGSEGLSDVNIRIERLRRAIDDDQEYRANVTTLALKEVELKRSEQLLAQGLISQHDFDQVRGSYNRQRALTESTEQIDAWRAQMDRLQQTVILDDQEGMPSAPLLRDVMMRAIDIEFDRVAVAERTNQLDLLRTQLRTRLEGLAESVEQDDLRWMDSSEFRVVTQATVSAIPTRSNRRLVALGLASVVSMLALGLTLTTEVVPTTIRSAPELRLKLALPTLGVIPDTSVHHSKSRSDRMAREQYRMLARRIRAAVPQRGARVLFVSALHGEGKTTVTHHVASALGRLGEGVVTIACNARTGGVGDDAATRGGAWARWLADTFGHRPEQHVPRDPPVEDRDTASTMGSETLGLSDYLQSPSMTFDEVALSSSSGHVTAVSLGTTTLDPDNFAGDRMEALLDGAAERYSMVLLDGPPVLPYADAEMLAQLADAVVLVTQAGRTPTAMVKVAFERLSSIAPVIGAVLTHTHATYMDLE